MIAYKRFQCPIGYQHFYPFCCSFSACVYQDLPSDLIEDTGSIFSSYNPISHLFYIFQKVKKFELSNYLNLESADDHWKYWDRFRDVLHYSLLFYCVWVSFELLHLFSKQKRKHESWTLLTIQDHLVNLIHQKLNDQWDRTGFYLKVVMQFEITKTIPVFWDCSKSLNMIVHIDRSYLAHIFLSLVPNMSLHDPCLFFNYNLKC